MVVNSLLRLVTCLKRLASLQITDNFPNPDLSDQHPGFNYYSTVNFKSREAGTHREDRVT